MQFTKIIAIIYLDQASLSNTCIFNIEAITLLFLNKPFNCLLSVDVFLMRVLLTD